MSQSESKASQFREQGGAATMDPSALRRWVTSRVMTLVGSEKRMLAKRQKEEEKRRKANAVHRVEYFHQLEDGYSQLAAQVLERISKRYKIELQCHLVHGPSGANLPEPKLLLELASYDSNLIAEHYGLSFPKFKTLPEKSSLESAARILASLPADTFTAHVSTVGQAMWDNDSTRLNSLMDELGCLSIEEAEAAREAGSARRKALKHYSGAMFYYAGEWYWGVDRLYHLEARLQQLGLDREPGQATIAARPAIPNFDRRDNGSLELEVYPSLRSPYTSIAFDRTLQLAEASGVKLITRPVLPMVMRGVPATREKGMYIFLDTAREARAAGVPYGKFYDPIGNPVRRAYALYPWAVSKDRGNDFLSAFLSAAFTKGINTNSKAGLRKVVEAAGLSWSEAQTHLDDNDWESLLEANRQAMYAEGLWGVPSFRLLDRSGQTLLATWGQDRLWLVARAIESQLARQLH